MIRIVVLFLISLTLFLGAFFITKRIVAQFKTKVIWNT